MDRFDMVEFAELVRNYRKEYPEQRLGQAMMNILWKIRPDLHTKARMDRIDPFYTDKRIPEFLDFLSRRS